MFSPRAVFLPAFSYFQVSGEPGVKIDSSAFVADQELIKALENRSTPIDCGEDRILFRQGESPAGLYILHEGTVTLTMESLAREVVMQGTASAGSLLGLPGLIGNEPYSLTARALKGSRLSFVKRDDFSSLMLTDPAMSVRVLRVLAAEVRTARFALSEL